MNTLQAVEQATHHYVKPGDVLQTAYISGSPDGHVEALLEFADFPLNAEIIDLGCGVGGMADRIIHSRPDVDITLVNFSEVQLGMCPNYFTKIKADAELTRINIKYDCAILASAACQMNTLRALKEALRLLRPDGFILLSDLAVSQSINLRDSIHAEFYSESDWMSLIKQAGLKVVDKLAIESFSMSHFSNLLDNKDWLHDAKPILWKLKFDDPFERHQNIAFQFSGGKDSTAALIALQDRWECMTVYFTDTGDLLPETYAFVERIAKDIPDFRIIRSDSLAVRKRHGFVSDAITSRSTATAAALEGGRALMLDTHTCCYLSIMKPMQDQMIADGITLIIRGQKLSDKQKGQLVSADVIDGVEFYHPIEHLTDDEVMDMLKDIDLPMYYNHMKSAPDCKSCTGWWSDGRMNYLASTHPELAKQYAETLVAFRGELASAISNLDTELKSYVRHSHV